MIEKKEASVDPLVGQRYGNSDGNGNDGNATATVAMDGAKAMAMDGTMVAQQQWQRQGWRNGNGN